jgi:Dolichyl-phosphate-mannose-protein mannosyltransferase
MLAFLLPLNFLLVYGNLQQILKTQSYRELFLISGVVWATQLVLFTEVLSWVGALAYIQVLILWSLSLLFLFMRAFKNLKPIYEKLMRDFRYAIKSLPTSDKLKLTFLSVLCLALFILAIVVPPNNWDSMTYHMARIMHWMQNKSINHYPSSIMRQHFQAPFAEYVIMHLQILSGSDRYANLVQWCSYIGTLAGVSLITRELGGDRPKQISSILLAATIPMAILQATSTQNDLVVSFWIVSSVYFLMTFFRQHNLFLHAILIGLSIGLALLCKSTAYVWLLPFCLAFVFYALSRKIRHIQLVKIAGIILSCVAILNANHFYRNYKVYGHVMGGTSQERDAYVNVLHTPEALASNVVRNVNIHLKTPFYYWDRACRLATIKIHTWLGMDLHDPRTTYYSSGNVVFYESWSSYNEDIQGNFLHFSLISFTGILLIWGRKKIFFRRHLIYFCLCLGGFLLFCYLLRWQECIVVYIYPCLY